MISVPVPQQLLDVLAGSPLEGPIQDLRHNAGKLLQDNAMTFFPGYTDHGTEHVARVLAKTVDLIPPEVWTAGLLQPEDAAVLIGACLLHDLALHLHEGGFAELVTDSPTSRWSTPLPWFDEQQGDRPADRPWSALWVDFQREARHFGQTQLEQILGPRSGGVPRIAQQGDLPDSGRWSTDDRLLVGEFLRRHHARLSLDPPLA